MKTLRKPGRLALIASLVVALAGAWTGATFSAFTSTQGSSGNIVTAAPDWKGPAVTGGVGDGARPLGVIREGTNVYVYANVTDSGNPASGVASVTSSVTVAGYGTISLPLAAGSWTVRGQTYNYRSAAQAIPLPFPEQTLSVDITATDNAGNTTNTPLTVVVDNTAPTATNIQTANGSTIAGRAQQNDTVTYTFSETMDPDSFLAGWSGAAQNVTVRLVNGGAGNDSLQIWNAANTAQLPFGSVNLGRTDYTGGNVNFTGSSMLRTGSAITVTLGTPSGATTTAGGSGTMQWTPTTAPDDLAGNALSGVPRTETGTADREF